MKLINYCDLFELIKGFCVDYEIYELKLNNVEGDRIKINFIGN